MVSGSLIFGCHVGPYQGYARLDRSFLTVLAFEGGTDGPAHLEGSASIAYRIT